VGGLDFTEALKLFNADPETEAVLLIGEIGGTAEQRAAEYVRNMTKPVAGFIAGAMAPPGKRMGHAGAIISGSGGTASEKVAALRAAGVSIAQTPADLGITVKSLLS
jgi:succinyl-CoA synthetase alpha subunit